VSKIEHCVIAEFGDPRRIYKEVGNDAFDSADETIGFYHFIDGYYFYSHCRVPGGLSECERGYAGDKLIIPVFILILSVFGVNAVKTDGYRAFLSSCVVMVSVEPLIVPLTSMRPRPSPSNLI